MAFFKWLKDLFQSSGDQEAYWLHVRCQQCGEVLKTRVDLNHDLTTRYDQNGQIAGYFTRKMLIGSNTCFNQIEAKVEFDPRRNPLAHEVHGGQLISREEFLTAQGESPAGNSG